ncbi:kinase [Aureococcus anophagefferens]|nr:kinase [Aureococcus anophagefferens]
MLIGASLKSTRAPQKSSPKTRRCDEILAEYAGAGDAPTREMVVAMLELDGDGVTRRAILNKFLELLFNGAAAEAASRPPARGDAFELRLPAAIHRASAASHAPPGPARPRPADRGAEPERLHAHFVRDDSVVVPRPVGRRRSPDVLVEEFVAGVPVLDFARGDEARAAKIAEAGARRLKMVLHHNFVHGDLHPGNMLVNDRAQLVLLDAGICVEIGDRAHEDMVSILKAMLEARGADAGRLILGAHANRGDFGAIDRESEARFVTGIDEMVARSLDQPIFEPRYAVVPARARPPLGLVARRPEDIKAAGWRNLHT